LAAAEIGQVGRVLQGEVGASESMPRSNTAVGAPATARFNTEIAETAELAEEASKLNALRAKRITLP
jgi:hypothetical protein